MDSYICPKCNQIYKGWSNHTNCFVCGTKLVPYTEPKQADAELPVSCEFPMPNFPYKVKAYKIGNDTMITFSGDDYFTMTVRDTGVHISTYGG
jgi:hypothetical protein